MIMSRLISKLRRHFLRYDPVVEVFVYKKNIENNYKVFQNACPSLGIAPVLKANAYGHGLVEVGRIVDALRPPFIIVDSIFEALRLRRAGVASRILVVGYTWPSNIVSSKIARTEFAVTAIETLEELAKTALNKICVQVKFDTGMHRQGIDPRDFDRVVELSKQNSNICITGFFSHCGEADDENLTATKNQIAVWNALVKKCRESFPRAKHYHFAATYASVLASSIDATMMRLGIGLYGLATSPHQKDWPLLPALELKTIVTSLRTVEAGESVGYGGAFVTNRPTKLATIPVGYNEGLDRRLSNKGFVAVNGKSVPIAGRISMNIASIDVTDVSDVRVGSKVTVVSREGSSASSIAHMAELANTITYDLAVHIPAHLRRTVV